MKIKYKDSGNGEKYGLDGELVFFMILIYKEGKQPYISLINGKSLKDVHVGNIFTKIGDGKNAII